MTRLSHWIYERSTGWVTLIGLVVFLLFTALVLPAQSSQAESYSGAVGSPDTSLYYTPQQLYRFAESYGVEGRRSYVRARLTFDIVFPLVYTLFLTTSISWLVSKAAMPKPFWRQLNLVPLAGMLFDFLENGATATVMVRYPRTTPILAGLAGVFTTIKWAFVGGSFILLFILVGLTLRNSLRKNPS